MTPLKTIQSWPREQLESAFAQRENQLAKALQAEKLARAGFDKAAEERDQLKQQLLYLQSQTTPPIFSSMADALKELPACPRPKGGQLGHWWYIDSELIGKCPDYVPCICGTCGQQMFLTADSDPDEWPAT